MRVHKRFGIDGAIFYSVVAKMIQTVAGIGTIYFIYRYLTKVEQGFYFTFGSILAIQSFFEMGLSTIIVQFVAHEKSELEWGTQEGTLQGNSKAVSRLSSLLRFSIKWYSIMSVLLFVGLIITGYFFFSRYGAKAEPVDWKIPWTIVSTVTAINLFFSPFLGFLEGLGKVKEVAKFRMVSQLLQSFSLILFFFLHQKLYSSPLAACLATLIIPVWLITRRNRAIFYYIWQQIGEWKVNYKVEIFPYQWRIALSWLSGYFMTQLFNPIIFITDGPIAAGQMGMTSTILNNILYTSFSWINTKVPTFSGLIARRQFNDLDSIFNRTLKQSGFVCLLSLFAVNIIIYILQYLQIPIGSRLLPGFLVSLLSFITLSGLITGALAVYLRCHKKEPLFLMSMGSAILTGISIFVFGHFFKIYGIVAGYFVTTVIGLIWTVRIFKRKKLEWHSI